VGSLRRWGALLSLTLGGFAIGCNEFLAMGVLPEAAAELTGGGSGNDAVGSASIFVWGYAAGVVLGALAVGPIARFLRARLFLCVSLLAMAVITLGVAWATSVEAVVAFRISSGVPHAAFLGVAAIVAAKLLGRRHEARGVAIVIGGLTIASMVGVPLGTWLGQVAGWRWSYLVIGTLFAVAAIGCMLSLSPAPALGSPKGAWRGLGNRRLWAVITVYALVNSGAFAIITFIAPIITESPGGSAPLVPVLLAMTGFGMTVGNYVGGALADRSRGVALTSGLATLAIGYGLLGFSGSLIVTTLGLALVGYTLGALGPYIQTGLMATTTTNPELGSSLNSLSANAGSVIGGVVGSAALLALGDARAVVAAAAVLSVAGVGGIAVLSVRDKAATAR